MSIEILSIRDNNIRKAAEKADSGQGNLSYNGKLDASEIKVFMSEAEKLDCNYSKILGYVDQAGANLEDPRVKDRVKKLRTIYDIKNSLKTSQKQKKDLPNPNSKILGTTIGTGLGFGGGVLLGSSLLSGLGTLPALGILAISALVGGITGNQIGKNVASHEEKCAEKQGLSLDNKIEHYQKVLEELRAEFKD